VAIPARRGALSGAVPVEFVLDGSVYMDGYDQELQLVPGDVYEYDQGTVRVCS
jgi:hypothetical protein